MKAQKNYHKGARALVANGSIMNIEYSPNPSSGKPIYERTPKKRDSFKIKKTKRFDATEACSPHGESPEKHNGFVPSSQFDSNGAMRNSAYTNRAYAAANGSMAHYTLMSYSNSNNQLNSNVTFGNKPEGLTGPRLQEPADHDVNHIFDDFEQFSFQTFPSYFNPRTASNMPHQEKVNKWIENVPTFNVSGERWRSECYSVDLELDWEEQEFDYGLAHHHDYMPFSLATADEVLHLQAKRLDTLVRRIYELTPEIPLSSTTTGR
ncbi:LANO_0C08350g1_1 [Lachancea nothofagi CBS 11611]|uniref:LANO_0C08350g1_1 n=1 Tax=Lachancea nothofagi CBS 11611 TaxID=1266666 RepID=A0A1G4J955_9SACH|nr:LANO_0C08350g1_1 [Lachancea nothofagi CBS 11611]